MRTRWAEAGERRRALDAALAEGGPLDPLGNGNAAAVDDWLGDFSSNNGGTSVGQVADIRLISDDPDDLTLGQARMLGTADVLAHEPDVPVAILDRARADAVRIAIGAGETVPERAGLSVVLRR
jgi:uroporphyrin-III C-methyltransferase/precorrin-2 dehydrogenase/sirohydrochlorin ferrochelatase